MHSKDVFFVLKFQDVVIQIIETKKHQKMS